MDGKTVGHHFAGPTWQFDDGSAVVGKVVERAAGATSADIPLLKLAASPQSDRGLVAGVTTIRRLATKGGVKEGTCDMVGALFSAPYVADYAFYRGMRSSQRR